MDRTSEGYGNVHTEYLSQKCKLVGMGAKCLSDISERGFVRFPIDFCVRSTYPNAKPLLGALSQKSGGGFSIGTLLIVVKFYINLYL